MKKRKNIKPTTEPIPANPVAKFAGRFNKAKVIDDKNAYRRKDKHAKREQEASPSVPK
ncbi:hypothetical protein MCAMS1_00207 [biofilm metagenome]